MIKSAALAAVLALGASQAVAQPGWYYGAPTGPGIAPRQVAAVVRSVGLTPVTPPARVGPNYVVHALDRSGETVRVVIDAEDGDIVRIRPLGPRMARPGPWNRWNTDLGMREWWASTPPRPRRSVPIARVPIDPDDLPVPAGPRIDPPIAMGAPAGAPDGLPPPGIAPPPGAALPPPPRVNTARTAPNGPPPPPTAVLPGEGRMNRPPLAVQQGAHAAKPRTATATPGAPLPKPKPSAEQMAAKPAATAPGESKPTAHPRVVLPGGPATKGEKAVESTGTVPAATAAAPVSPAPAAAASAPAKSEPAPAASGTSAVVPMQTLE